MSTLTIALQNSTSQQTVYAYITDGQTPYYPPQPSANGQKLAVNISIPLPPPGGIKYVTIPQLAGARLWFCVNDTLDFYLNPGSGGPGLVEPSVGNSSDSNINKNWDFCEFTYNGGIYANITYVDFVALPISLTLTNNSGSTQHVSGMNAGGFQTIVSGLQQQSASDGQPWGSLVVSHNGTPIRALSPNMYISGNPSAFGNYFQSYVQQAWQKYQGGTSLSVDTQAGWGVVQGTYSGANGGTLTFPGGISFAEPSAADIFSNSTGPFAGGANVTAEQLNIGARLAAALNRSTLRDFASQPDGTAPANYYRVSPTNHYARVVHAAQLDGRGYAFPYDDVTPNAGQDQSGFVADGAPKLWTVAVGGANATTNVSEAAERQTALVAAMPKSDTSAPPATTTPLPTGDALKTAPPTTTTPSAGAGAGAVPPAATMPAAPADQPKEAMPPAAGGQTTTTTPAQPTTTPGCCGSLMARFRRKK